MENRHSPTIDRRVDALKLEGLATSMKASLHRIRAMIAELVLESKPCLSQRRRALPNRAALARIL